MAMRKVLLTILLITIIKSWHPNYRKPIKRQYRYKKHEKDDKFDLNLNIDKNFEKNLRINEQDFKVKQSRLFNIMLKEFRTIKFDKYLIDDEKKITTFPRKIFRRINYGKNNFHSKKNLFSKRNYGLKKYNYGLKKYNYGVKKNNYQFKSNYGKKNLFNRRYLKDNDSEINKLKGDKNYIIINTDSNNDKEFKEEARLSLGSALEFK